MSHIDARSSRVICPGPHGCHIHEAELASRSVPRVCLVAPFPPPYGGIAHWSRLVVGELTARGLDFDMIDSSPGGRLGFDRNVAQRITVGARSIFRSLRELRQSIRRGSKVVHVTTSGGLGTVRDILLFRVAARNGLSRVYHIHCGRVPDIESAGTLQWRLLKHAMLLSTVTLAIDNSTFRVLEPLL